MQKSKPIDNKTDNTKVEEKKTKDIKLNKDKDYIYFDNSEMVLDELDIEYKDIFLNFSNNSIQNTLNDETKKMKSSIKYTETKDDNDEYNNIESIEYKIYEYYVYENYISLLVNYYNFDRENVVSFVNSKTYLFNKEDGNTITNEELLKAYNLTIDNVKSKVKTYVEDKNHLSEEEKLDAEATVNSMSNYALFVDKIGRLSISVLVKSDQKDYNDIIILS